MTNKRVQNLIEQDASKQDAINIALLEAFFTRRVIFVEQGSYFVRFNKKSALIAFMKNIFNFIQTNKPHNGITFELASKYFEVENPKTYEGNKDWYEADENLGFILPIKFNK